MTATDPKEFPNSVEDGVADGLMPVLGGQLAGDDGGGAAEAAIATGKSEGFEHAV